MVARYEIDIVEHEDDGTFVMFEDYVLLQEELYEKHAKLTATLDALQEMCRRDCSWHDGYYDTMGSRTLRDALGVLVGAGRLEWVTNETRGQFRMAKDKEA